jgi:hypothetical protein
MYLDLDADGTVAIYSTTHCLQNVCMEFKIPSESDNQRGVTFVYII